MTGNKGLKPGNILHMFHFGEMKSFLKKNGNYSYQEDIYEKSLGYLVEAIIRSKTC